MMLVPNEDGEIVLAWVLEPGALDLEVIKQTFGFERLHREGRFTQPKKEAES